MRALLDSSAKPRWSVLRTLPSTGSRAGLGTVHLLSACCWGSAEQVSHWLSMTSRIQRPSFTPFSLDCNACPERPSWVVRRSDPCCATDVRAAAAPALVLDLRYKRASARTCVPLPEVSDPPALAESWRTSPAEFREKLFA